jgi:glycosyltransferase involved in cell wall biosynthesis
VIEPDVSIVIPLKDEELNVVPLHDEITGVMVQLGVPYEIIFVDDGSQDATYARLLELQAQDPAVRVVKFTRNFGQTAGFAAGFALARGRFIVTSDGDLQNDPKDIPTLLKLARRHDIVCGWRRHRKDAVLTRLVPSIVANRLLSIVSGVKLHDNGCSLKVFRAEVVKPLKLRPGMHRFLPALASQLGGRVAEIAVNHRPRQHGHSKYGLSRTFRVVADLFQLRTYMRQAVDPSTPDYPLYEIAEIRESRVF